MSAENAVLGIGNSAGFFADYKGDNVADFADAKGRTVTCAHFFTDFQVVRQRQNTACMGNAAVVYYNSTVVKR